MSLLTVAEMATEYCGTGTFTSAQIQLAIDLAEFDIEDNLNTYLSPSTGTEEYMWPVDDGKVLLKYNHVISIESLVAKHSLDVDCEWIQDEECGVILNAEEGLILAVSHNLSLSNCSCGGGIRFPDRVVITYVSGFTALETAPTTALGKALRMAICLLALDKAEMLDQGQDWQGAYNIASWNSMDYGERREVGNVINNALGPSVRAQEAWRILNRIKGKPAIMLRSSGRF